MPKANWLSEVPEYSVWEQMKNRCCNENSPSFPRYGGRGIKLCKDWYSFRSFYRDMGVRPDGFQLERVDNDGPYCPENCVWASRSEQARNKRNTRRLTFCNVTLSISEWSDLTGLKTETIRARLDKLGWSVEEALTVAVA